MMKSHNLSGTEKYSDNQRHAFYSEIPKNRERTQNIGPNCKTVFPLP